MIFTNLKNIKPILESSKGIHLTSYISNSGDLADFNRQLEETINKAKKNLADVMGAKEITKFLGPITSLIGEERILTGFKGNIGIFRTKNSFWILNIPIEVEQLCVVATTFHIKPLLKWMQLDRDFLLLGLEEDTIHLYQGSNHSLKSLYSFNLKDLKESSYEIIYPLNETINSFTKNSGIRIFVSGENSVSDELLKNLDYENISRLPFWPFFDQECLEDICLDIRSGLLQEAQEALEQSIMDFNYASDLKIANRNIVEIARAAVLGRVTKLLIAEEVKIFGKLNLITGAIALNLEDEDHEDDDLLDDIAQVVLAHGGQVSIVTKDKIPFGRAALAILENSRPYVRAKINKPFEMGRSVG